MILLIIYSTVMTYLYVEKRHQNNVNYSNYQNCLIALSQFDKNLAEYLKNRRH